MPNQALFDLALFDPLNNLVGTFILLETRNYLDPLASYYWY